MATMGVRGLRLEAHCTVHITRPTSPLHGTYNALYNYYIRTTEHHHHNDIYHRACWSSHAALRTNRCYSSRNQHQQTISITWTSALMRSWYRNVCKSFFIWMLLSSISTRVAHTKKFLRTSHSMVRGAMLSRCWNNSWNIENENQKSSCNNKRLISIILFNQFSVQASQSSLCVLNFFNIFVQN